MRRPRVAGTRKPSGDAPGPAPRPNPRPNPFDPEPAPPPADETPTSVFPAVEVAPAEPEATADASAISPLNAVEEPDEPEAAEPDASAFRGLNVPAASKPSPRPKLRDGGIRKPTNVEEAEAEVAADEVTAKPSLAKKAYLLPALLVIVGLLLAGAAVIFKINANEVSAATSNTALLDVAKTAQVKDQVSQAAETLFSYDFNDIAKTENAAKDLLVGDEVRGKYDKLMGEVKRLAPTQKMIVTSKVTRSGVILLNGDLAKVMVFIDQSSTRADTKQTSAGSAQLHLNAELQDGKWKITDMDTYIAPSAPAAPAPSAPVSPAPSK
ncbi:hypothetical protein [Amycolatopsis sp.]|uniref:hypothetical protein n=1 Tax=Amycolatopsis sp. TaxID=37632 RepID=UPI002E090519|nr:hypothetical protein [Amycolatopsis sp.]